MTQETKAVSKLRIGDMVNLEGDDYADPNHDNIAYECEYSIVCEIEMETAFCTVVHFEGGPSVGFPPDHLVEVVEHDDGYETI